MARVDTTGGTGFTVDNGTGLQVRTKLQQVIDALRSLQSGSGDPTVGVAAYQLHVDEVSNTSQILKIRNKANDDFVDIGDVAQTNLGLLLKAGGVMTGVLTSSAGSTSAPSFNFGDSGTGLYKKGTNQIGLVANQAEIAFVDQNGLTVNNQKEIRFSEPTSAATGGSVQYVGIKAPSALAANLTLTLPTTNPAVAGYALISTDTSGTLSWGVAGGAVGGSTDQVFWENDQTVTTSYAITNNKNAGSFGPITIASGVVVTVGSGETWSVV